jgi:hypothetical protein
MTASEMLAVFLRPFPFNVWWNFLLAGNQWPTVVTGKEITWAGKLPFGWVDSWRKFSNLCMEQPRVTK